MIAYLILIYYGFISLSSQLLIFRTLAVVFYGNELFLGVALSSWLFWVGLGSLLSKRITKSFKDSAETLSKFLVVVAFFLPLEILLVRLCKVFFPFGTFIGPLPMIFIIFSVLSVFCFTLGAIFPVICNFISSKTKYPLANTYFCESVGAIIAGLLFTFVFIGRLPISLIVLLISAGAILLGRRKSLFLTAGLIALLLGFLPLENLIRKIEWRGYQLLRHAESRYSDITVTKLGSLMNLFEDGKISAHFPDRQFYEEIVHLPMLLHKNPKNILVGSSAAWGQLSEILEYDVDRIDYIELDSKLIDTLMPFLGSRDKISIEDERVNIHNIDMRLWLKNTPSNYDIMILNLGEPSNLRINRFYTKEFYKEIRRVLNPDGILSFSVPSAENYLSVDIGMLNASVYETLKKEFDYIELLPGDNLLFLASNSKITLREDILKSRYSDRGISNIYVVPSYFKNRLSAERRDYIRASLSSVKNPKINSDLEPVTYHYFAKIWMKKFNSPIYFIFTFIIVIAVVQLMRNSRNIASNILQQRKLIPMFTIGFIGIVAEIVLLLAFQSACGLIYWQLGLLFASFMFGLALGSLIGKKFISLNISALQISMIIMISLIMVFLPKFCILDIQILLITFPLFLILIGLFVGAAFSLTARIYQSNNTAVENTASYVYAADILGASSGPLLAGSLFIPFFGLTGTLWIAIAVGLVGLALFKIK